MTAAVGLLTVLLPILAAAAIAGIRAPIGVLAVYAAFVPIGSAVSLPLPLPAPLDTLSTLIGIAALASMTAHLAVARRRAPALPASLPVWLLLVGFSGATAAWSIDAAASVDDLLMLLSLVALYGATALLAIDRGGLQTVEVGIVAGGAVCGAYGLLLLATGELPVSGAGIPRFATGGGGEVGDPNITAAALLLPFLVAVSRALRHDVRHRGWNAVAALLCLAGLALTLSRGAAVALLVGLAVFALADRRPKVAAVMVGAPLVLVVVALLLLPDGFLSRAQQTSSTGRSQIWGVALDACPAYCWAGSGLGTFGQVHTDAVMAAPQVGGNRLRFEAHSVWLGTLIELGLVGFALLLAALAVHVHQLQGLPAGLRAPPLAGLAALAAANTFLANLEFKYFWLVIIYATLCAAVSRSPAAGRTPQPFAAAQPQRGPYATHHE